MVPKGAKSAPRRVQEPLRGPQEPPTCALRVAWTATWVKPVTQVPPAGLQDAILAPSGLDFGPCGSRFWRAPQARPGTSRKLGRIHAGTMLHLYFHACPATRRPSGRHCGPIGARLCQAPSGIGGRGAAFNFLLWKTSLVRWFAFIFRAFS